LEAIPELPGAEADPATACDLLAYASVQVAPESVPALRLKPGPGAGERLPVSYLKHADEQSVVGLAAVLQAVAQHHLATMPFTDWGVLGAPRFIGRVAMAVAMHRFAAEGAWGISPHLIPHRSLHALSGTVSQALKIHGPNFGVGGGPYGAAEALFTAAALLGTRPLSGVWIVLTGWEPEPVPAPDGRTATPAVCNAVALALVPARANWTGFRLQVQPRSRHGSGPAAEAFTLEQLRAALTAADSVGVLGHWTAPHGGRLRLERAGVALGLPAPHLFRQRNGVHGRKEASGAGPGSRT
jgi:hypothetical protein